MSPDETPNKRTTPEIAKRKGAEPAAPAAASDKNSGDTAPANMPLFFHSPVPLDAKRHQRAAILPVQDFSFAANTNAIPLNVIEFGEACKSYPIIFTEGENSVPLAIVGLEQKNYFVGSDGRWKDGVYTPAYVRKYPFIFMDLPERQQFLLCVDEGATQYSEDGRQEGAVPFYDGEQPSELTRNALEFCTAFHGHHQLSTRFCEALRKANLLMPMQSNVKLYNGREIQLGGFQLIDENKWNELPQEQFLEFRKEGWLPFVYFALLSATNWSRMVDLAADTERKLAA